MSSNTILPSSGKRPAQGKKPRQTTDSLLESLRDIGRDAGGSLSEDVFKGIPQDFFSQMFGQEQPKAKASGDLMPGGSIEIKHAIEEQKQENQVLRAKLATEQRMRQELEVASEQKSQDLRVELQAVMQEVSSLAMSTAELSNETKIAVLQAPVNPGIYHVGFFTRLREFIKSFRQKIQGASLWMQAANSRAQKKKGFWGGVQKGGAKRLLSQEDYMQRSAG
jgi:hypothetical protein